MFFGNRLNFCFLCSCFLVCLFLIFLAVLFGCPLSADFSLNMPPYQCFSPTDFSCRRRNQLGWGEGEREARTLLSELKENPVLLHPHIASSFMLQLLSKHTPRDLVHLLLILKNVVKELYWNENRERTENALMQLCGKPGYAILCWSCFWEGAVTHLPALHISTAPTTTVSEHDMLTYCLWGRKILLPPLPRQNQKHKWFAQGHMGNLQDTRN